MRTALNSAGPIYLISTNSQLIRSNPALISSLIRFGVDFLEAGAILDHRYDTERNEKIVRGIGAAALTLQSHNLWHRRGEAVKKKKSRGGGRERKRNGRKEQGERRGRKINSKRARGRQVGRTDIKIPTRRGRGGAGRKTRGQAFFMRFISLIKRPVVMRLEQLDVSHSRGDASFSPLSFALPDS